MSDNATETQYFRKSSPLIQPTIFFSAPVLSTAVGSELWEANCTSFVDAGCQPDKSPGGEFIGTYLDLPSVVDFIENDPQRDIVDHYAFLTVDPEPSDGVVGAAYRATVCFENQSTSCSLSLNASPKN